MFYRFTIKYIHIEIANAEKKGEMKNPQSSKSKILIDPSKNDHFKPILTNEIHSWIKWIKHHG